MSRTTCNTESYATVPSHNIQSWTEGKKLCREFQQFDTWSKIDAAELTSMTILRNFTNKSVQIKEAENMYVRDRSLFVMVYFLEDTSSNLSYWVEEIIS